MKKQISSLLLAVFMMSNYSVAFADEQSAVYTKTSKTEHLKVTKTVEKKKAPTNIVVTTPTLNTVVQYNIIEVSFAKDFSTKNCKVGDKVDFMITGGLQTEEGTSLLPDGSQVQAEITEVIQPKSFNRSGKVTMTFNKVILPDGSTVPFDARVYSNKTYLSRGKLNAFGKGLGTTLGTGAVATGAGCGIGVAAGAVVVGGFAIGLPIGIAVGAIAGCCTPGLHYKAKAGDKLLIQLSDNLELAK